MRSSQHRDPGPGSSRGNQGQNGQAAQQGQEKLGLECRTPTPNTGLISPSMKPGTEDKGSEDNLGTTVLCHPKGHCDKREVGQGAQSPYFTGEETGSERETDLPEATQQTNVSWEGSPPRAWNRAEHCLFCPYSLQGAHLTKLFLIHRVPPLGFPWSLEVKDMDSTIWKQWGFREILLPQGHRAHPGEG